MESARSAAESAAGSAARLARLAESAARSAARSARSAESAAWSAAWSVAESAESAARSAEWSAAESAESAAAESAARSAAELAARKHYKSEAAMLIELLRAENQNTMIITLTTYNSPAGTRQPSGASHTFYAADWRYDPTQQPPCLHIINTSGGESVIAVPFDDFRVDGEPTRIKGKEVQP